MILSSPQWALSLENPLMLWWQRLPRAMWCSPGSPQSRGVMKESCITLRRWGEHFVWKCFSSSFYENDNNSQFLAFHIICANICTFSAIKLNLFGVFDCWPYKTNNLNMSPCDFTSSYLLSHWHVNADHSVFQGQTPGRGWTLVCQWSLPALPCLTWPRVNPTASVCAAATPLVWARLLYPQKRSRSEINWVRLVHILFGTVYQGIYGWTIWRLQYITISSVYCPAVFLTYLVYASCIMFCLIPNHCIPSVLPVISLTSSLSSVFSQQTCPRLRAIQWASGTQTHQWWSPGGPRRMPNTWSATILNVARWAPTSGCLATTNLSNREGMHS